MNRFRLALGIVGMVVIVALVYVGLQNPTPQANSTSISPVSDRTAAPDFTGINSWINGPPQTLKQLRGKVVLVDFWTFSCINCVRTLPHLHALYDTYRSLGLEIVGVHTPEFEFEKDANSVAAAVKRLNITWPVAVDSQMATWNAYQNAYWPAQYILDQNGRIAFHHIGEGDDATIDTAVASLLSAPAVSASAAPPTGDPGALTPEIYAGSQRGQSYGLADGENYGNSGAVTTYSDGQPQQADHILLNGQWIDSGEYVIAAAPAHIRLKFHATNLFVVAGAQSGSLSASVTVDGRSVLPSQRGAALRDDGSFSVNRNDLYPLLAAEDPGSHVIDITVPRGFQLYTFTFG